MREHGLGDQVRIASKMNDCLPEPTPGMTPHLLAAEQVQEGDYILETFPGDAYAWIHVHAAYPYRQGLHAIRDCFGNEHLYATRRRLAVFREGEGHDPDLLRS